MEALFYLFPYPLLLLLLVVITFVAVLVIPKRIFPKKRWGWSLLALEVIVLVAFSWYYIQPKVYPETYLEQAPNSVEYLTDAAKNRGFYIGTAVSNRTEGKENAPKYFNSITPENELKWGRLIGEDLRTYDFSQADSIVDFGLQHNVRIRGHVLVWGRAADFFKSPDLRTLLKDVPEDKMPDTLQYLIKNNIVTVLERYRGKISQWDVVNEPLNVFDGGFDENIYYEYLGKEYIANSFRWAHEVDPAVTLFLNEQFDQYDSEKAHSFIKLVEELVKENVPIHGVGIQAHAMFTIPKIEPFRAFISKMAGLGLTVEITELDARLRLFDCHEDPYLAQGRFFQEFSAACLENPACTGITVWGISDRSDWYDNMGVFRMHRPNKSTPFDAEMNAKPAYYGLLNAMKNQ